MFWWQILHGDLEKNVPCLWLRWDHTRLPGCNWCNLSNRHLVSQWHPEDLEVHLSTFWTMNPDRVSGDKFLFYIAARFQSIDTCMKCSRSLIFGLILAQGSPGTNFAELYKMGTDPSYKWGFNPYKWPYKWVTRVGTSRSGVISPHLQLEAEPFL